MVNIHFQKQAKEFGRFPAFVYLIITMYIYHVLINAPGSHIIRINLNTTFYTHVEVSPTMNYMFKNHFQKQVMATWQVFCICLFLS